MMMWIAACQDKKVSGDELFRYYRFVTLTTRFFQKDISMHSGATDEDMSRLPLRHTEEQRYHEAHVH